MTRFRVPPKSLGIEIGLLPGMGGAKYNPDPNGIIEVDNPEHEATIRKSGYLADQEIGEINYNTSGIHEGKECPKCGFQAYVWQKNCPRDNSVLRRTE